MTELDDLVRRSQARWNRALLLGLLARGLGLGLMLGGCVLLLGRVSGFRWDLPAIGLAGLLGLAWAIVRFRRQRVSRSQVLTLLDLRAGGRGEVLQAAETGRAYAVPSGVGTRPRPAWRRSVAPALLPGLLFFVATLFVPLRALAQSPLDALASERLAQLEDLAATLKETIELEDELQEEIQQNLETLRGSSEEPRPSGEAMREALDALEQRLGEAAEAAASELEDVVRQASAQAEAGASPEESTRQKALDELGEMLDRAAEQGLLPQRGLSEGLQQQLSQAQLSQEARAALQELADAGALSELGELGKSLSAEDLERLAKALGEGLSEAALEKLAQMAREGLLNQTGRQAPPMDPEALARYLRELQSLPQQPGGT